MKKTLAMLLALIVCLSFCACSDNEPEVSEEPTRTPLEISANMPTKYSSTVMTYEENSTAAKAILPAIDSLIGYLLSAYETYTAQQFCEYVYNEVSFDVLNELQEDMDFVGDSMTNSVTADNAEKRAGFDLSQMAFHLIPQTVEFTAWKYSYAIDVTEDTQDENIYEEFRASLIDLLNKLTEDIYGVNGKNLFD